MHLTTLTALALCSTALSIHVKHTGTGTCGLPAAQATAKTESSTSKVKGKAFDRILMVMLETTSFGNATSDGKIDL